jgi:hypothetical protein
MTTWSLGHLERGGKQPLGGAEAVPLRRVEEVDPEVGGVADGSDGGRLVGRPPLAAQLPRSEGDPRNLKITASQSDLLHCSWFPHVEKGVTD